MTNEFQITDQPNQTCPCCLTPESTEHYAVLPLLSDQMREAILPHQYAICDSCHKQQVADSQAGKMSVLYGSYAGGSNNIQGNTIESNSDATPS